MSRIERGSETSTLLLEGGLRLVVNSADVSATRDADWWPCAAVLGRFLSDNRHLVRDRRVTELRCRLGLCSAIAAKVGAREVLMVDRDTDAAGRTAHLNHIAGLCRSALLTYPFAPTEFTLATDLIVSVIPFSRAEEMQPLVATVALILARNPNAEFVFTHKRETECSQLCRHLDRFGLVGERVSSHEHRLHFVIDTYSVWHVLRGAAEWVLDQMYRHLDTLSGARGDGPDAVSCSERVDGFDHHIIDSSQESRTTQEQTYGLRKNVAGEDIRAPSGCDSSVGTDGVTLVCKMEPVGGLISESTDSRQLEMGDGRNHAEDVSDFVTSSADDLDINRMLPMESDFILS